MTFMSYLVKNVIIVFYLFSVRW